MFALLALVGGLTGGPAGGYAQENVAEAAQTLLRAGQLALQSERFADAERAFQELVLLESNEPRGHYYLGIAHLRQGQTESAIDSLQLARRLSARPNPAVFLELGTAYLRAGLVQDAESVLVAAHALAPNDNRIRMQLGWAYYQLVEGAKAKEAFEAVLDDEPQNSQAHFYLAMAEAALGNLDDSEASFESALRLAPHLAEAQVGLGRVLSQQGQDEKAVVVLEHALEEFPDIASHASAAHNELGLIRFRLGALEKALTHFEAVVSKTPDHRQAHYNLWMLHKRLGHDEKAAAARERFLALREDAPLKPRSLSRTAPKTRSDPEAPL